MIGHGTMKGVDDFPEDTFALGSSQYSSIYKKYRWLVETEQVKNNRFRDMPGYSDSLTDFFDEIIPEFKRITIERAKEWDEEPDLEHWTSLDLKLKLLLAKESEPRELQKRMLLGFFNLMKNQAWDLWSAMNISINSYPDLMEFVEGNIKGDLESNEAYGTGIYFFASILGMNDDEVRETFGDFDT